jgi:hypothetical protein
MQSIVRAEMILKPLGHGTMQAGAPGRFDHSTKEAGLVQLSPSWFKNRTVRPFLFMCFRIFSHRRRMQAFPVKEEPSPPDRRHRRQEMGASSLAKTGDLLAGRAIFLPEGIREGLGTLPGATLWPHAWRWPPDHEGWKDSSAGTGSGI